MLNPGKVPLEPYMGTHDCSHTIQATMAISEGVRMVVDQIDLVMPHTKQMLAALMCHV